MLEAFDQKRVRLSVVMPVYNAGHILPETLACLYAQTFLAVWPGEMEVITVNDASSDDSLHILEEAKSTHPELIRVIDLPENRGPGGARNAALDAAKGEYIGFLDSDDTIEPTTYEKLYRAATEGEGYDYADCGIINDNQGGRVIYYLDPSRAGQLSAETKNLLLSDVGYLWSRIYRRSLLQEPPVRFREGVVSEDLDFLSEVIARAGSAAVVEEALYRYRDTPDSASKKDAEIKFFETTILAMRGVYDRLSVLPDYDTFRAGAEYTLCRLGLTTLETIDGYEKLQAVTPDFAEKMRGILCGELRRMVGLSPDKNPVITEKLTQQERERIRSILP